VAPEGDEPPAVLGAGRGARPADVWTRSTAKENSVMQIDRRTRDRGHPLRAGIPCTLAALAILALPAFGPPLAAQQPNRQSYASPDEAVAALVAAVRSNDRTAFSRVLPDALEQIASNDDVQDNLTLLTFAKRLLTRTEIVKTDETTAVLYTGAEHVLFPIPIRRGSAGWFFDVEAGKKQLLERRIGQNESRAVDVCRLYVRAQKDYASQDRDGDGILEFAQRFRSNPGARDGLYWPNNDMTPESPFGPLISLAKAQGYPERGTRQEPFQGYFFRVLVRQGPSAPGGSKDYVGANGNMTEGFGCVAYPARWGVSGIMTFVVGPDGRIFEKNLGNTTVMYASAMSEFDPDETWAEVRR
jgi:hypothetical protein